MHEILYSLLGWVVLIDELIVVVEEARMALKVVLFASEELVNLGLPGSIEGFALWLRTVLAVVLV